MVRIEGPEPVDDVWVKLCMYLFPRSDQGRWRGSGMDGCVLNADGTERRVGVEAIQDGFRVMVADVMRQTASDEPVRYAPIVRECGRCELGGDDCSEHMG